MALAIVALAGFFTLNAAPSFGQMNTAEVAGVVKDPSGASIAGATVVATQAATQQKTSAVSSDSGEFLLAQLPVGEYILTVTAPGFKQAAQEHVLLHVGDRVRQDFQLELGEQSDTVTVEATSGLLQVQSAEIKDVIQNQQVLDLPLKDREFLELALLSEGVVNPPGGTRGDSLQQTGKLISILGQRTGHNLFLVDGVSVTDEYYNNVVLNPAPDVVSEFNILKTNYSPEFGGKSGGVINVITKSGTNNFHGVVYEFVRNNIFDAKNFFTPPNLSPPFRENQFGAALGGPIVKNKTFFFINYDGQRIRNSLGHAFNVPTQAERNGNVSSLVPAGEQLVDPVTKAPIPGNNLANDPNYIVNAAAQALLALVPLPNQSGSNNLLYVGQQSINNNQYNARLDQTLTSKDGVFARASVFDANEHDPFGSSVLNEALLPGFGRNLKTHTVNLSVGETHTFTSNLIDEFRFGWMRVSGGQADPNAGNPFASRYGLQGTTSNPADFGYPQVSLNGLFSAIGDATGFTSRVDSDFELYDNVIYHHGKHSIQFGGYFFHLNFNPSFPNNARGNYTFNGTFTGGGAAANGNALADFLFGFPSASQVGIGEGAEEAHTNWAHFYVEDGWQVTSSLKLDLGLRYEYNANLVAAPNQTSNIDLAAAGGPAFVVSGDPSTFSATQSALTALSASKGIPVVMASTVGWNNSLLTPRNIRLSPRVGLAWQVPDSHNTVIRSGFGIYTNQASYSILQNLAENIPFFLSKSISNSIAAPLTMNSMLTSNSAGTFGPSGVNHDFKVEYNEVWNLSVETPISSNTSLTLEYVGSRTVHADSSTVLNDPPAMGAARPFPNLAAFPTIRWDGWALFNAMTVKATRRFTHDLSFDATYTWSKSMDDASDAGTTNAEYNLPQNPYNMPAEKGDSSFDHRNRITANVVYDLPFGKGSSGWLHNTISGWRSSGILTVQSGAPFTINLPTSLNTGLGTVSGNNLERPNLLGNPNDGPKTPQQWFNIAAFTVPAAGTFGTAGRNSVIGPGLATLDLSLQKEAVLYENLKLQFRFDLYNSLNRPNFDLPGRIYGASNFGAVSSAEDPREIQFALKLMF